MTEEKLLAPPRTVAWLGYGGLIPFLTLATASLLDRHHGAIWSDALYGYAAIILSFVGALHWGLAMALPGLTERQRFAEALRQVMVRVDEARHQQPSWQRQRSAWFSWSVVPGLIAWPALLLSPPLAAPLLLIGFIAHYLQDRRLARQGTLPDWYLPLRRRLSLVACTCLVAGVFASCV